MIQVLRSLKSLACPFIRLVFRRPRWPRAAPAFAWFSLLPDRYHKALGLSTSFFWRRLAIGVSASAPVPCGAFHFWYAAALRRYSTGSPTRETRRSIWGVARSFRAPGRRIRRPAKWF